LGVAIGRRDMVLNLLEAHKLVVWPGELFSSGIDAVCVLLRNGGAMTSEANIVFDWLASQRCALGYDCLPPPLDMGFDNNFN
jgi:hypothetical protein